MAINTYKIYLMHKNGSTYEKLVDIKSFPDLGQPANGLETTTLSDPARTYIKGIGETPAQLDFTCNYTLADYNTLAALVGTEHDFAVWFGGTAGTGGVVTPDGSNGKIEFKGYLDVFITGGGVNEVVDMTCSIAPSTPPQMAST